MTNKIGRIGTALETALAAGILVLGLCAGASAQQAPPASQMPEEIPAQAQYPPAGPGQAGPGQPGPGMPPQGAQQQQGPAPAPDQGAGRISFIHGDVSTQHGGSNDWAAATLNTPVVNGDHISTGPNARAEIQLDHANILRLSDQTTANLVNVSRTQMQLEIGQGLANYEVLRGNEANIEIDTPNVGIRPVTGEGSYRVLVNSDGETIVDVRSGSAEISTPQGSTRVERDQRITIQGNADNAEYQISGAPGRDDWDRWNSDRDHTIESAQSWRNTNPNYTGTQDLDTYGQWQNVPDYGQVWFPSAGSGWAPYRDGRWVFEPYWGWTWVSYEPWGWAPYHYGRWFVYGGNWGWWPGPVYAGYYPMWAPAYVSFFGWGGGGFGLGVGLGGGWGFGHVGWLPVGPGDRFFPWYGRGVGRAGFVNAYNVHGAVGGFGPLRAGAFSNVDRAFNDEHVRAGFSSMESGQFGRGRVPMQQSRIDAGTFRQASMATGASPFSPSRQSFQSTDRPASASSIPNRSVSNQRFFSGNGARGNTGFQGGNNAGNFNRGGNSGNTPGNAARPGSSGFNAPNNANVNRGGTPNSIQSSRPGWRTFTPPSGGSQTQSNGGRSFEGQGTQQPRGNYSQPQGSNGGRTFEGQGNSQSRENYSQPRTNNAPPYQQPRQTQNYSRGGYNGSYGGGSSRPTLNMRQPVVTPRVGSSGRGSSGGSRGPSGGGSRGGSSGGGHGHH
ncbi:MAG TPA: DUF6600 domain-containing protein [Verrucomicrobiae bacterium]|nr:DUF6600 domain-containing protein [Verrucomicrobiae bacterium]